MFDSGSSSITDRLLTRLGFPSVLSGRYFLRKAVLLALEDGTLTSRITTGLYPRIAELYGTTPGSVERNIRFAVAAAWARERSALHIIFDTRPKNGQLICFLAETVRGQADCALNNDIPD